MVAEFKLPVLDHSRVLDQKDRASLVGWLFGSVMLSTAMAINIYDGFSVGRFRGVLDMAITASAMYCTGRAGKKYLEVYTVGYRNEAQRNMDEAVTETTVFYQHQVVQLQTKWQQYVVQLNTQYAQHIQTLDAQHQEAIQTLQYQISDYITDIEVLEERVSALKAQKFHEQEQARCDAEEAREYLENDRRAIQQMRDELALSEQRLETREHQMKHEAEQIWRGERDRLQVEQQRLDDYQAQLDAIEEGYKQQAMQMAQKSVMAEIEGYQEMITMLRDEISSMLCSKRIKGSNREALVANNILDALEDMGVFLKKTIYGYDGNNVWVAGDPLPTINGEKVNPDMALAYIWEELDKPKPLKHIQASVGALNLPTVKFCNADERLRIDVDLTPVDKSAVAEQKAREEKYFFPVEDESALLEFIDNALHINFMAMSGRGKTTLIDNIINLLAQSMGPDTEIRYANPKPDRKDHSFPITWIGVRESIYGLFEAAIEIRHRVDTNNRIQRQRQEATNRSHRPEFVVWNQRIYFLDEINVIVNYFKGKSREQVEEFFDTVPIRLNLDWERTQTFEEMRTELNHRDVVADLIKFTWRVGRSEKIKLVMAGQNLMPSQLSSSMTKDDAYAQAYICSGETAINRAKNEGVIKANIYEEAVKGIAAEEDKQINPFWGLFAPARGSGQPFISQFPAPSKYELGIGTDAQKPGLENSKTYLNQGLQLLDSSDSLGLRETRIENEPETEPNGQNQKPNFGFMENSETNLLNDYGDSINPIPHSEKGADMGGIENLNRTQTELESVLSSNMSATFYTAVLQAYERSGNVTATIEIIWGLKRSRSLQYQVAKWKVRHVLNTREIIFESKVSDENCKRDRMTYDELIEYLEGK